jgi:hypothetical protein
MNVPYYRLWLLFLALAFLGGCMTSPLNGQDISATIDPDPNTAGADQIEFSGWTLNATDQVTLQGYDVGTGKWKDLLGFNVAVSQQAVADVDVEALKTARLQAEQLPPVAGKDYNNWYAWKYQVHSYLLSSFGQYDANKKRMFYEVRAVNAKAPDSVLVSFDLDTYPSCKDEHMPNGGGMAVIQNCKSKENKVTLWGKSCGGEGQKACVVAGSQWTCGTGLFPSLMAADVTLPNFGPGVEVTIPSKTLFHFLTPMCRSSCGSSGQACCTDLLPFNQTPPSARAVKCAEGLYCSEDVTCTSGVTQISPMDTHCLWNSLTVTENATLNGTMLNASITLKASCPSGDGGGGLVVQDFGPTTFTRPLAPNEQFDTSIFPLTYPYNDQREPIISTQGSTAPTSPTNVTSPAPPP